LFKIAGMNQFSTIREIQECLAIMAGEGRSIGFVPTMGALHQGHISLLMRSRMENDITVCSIFVNPTQFNNPADLKKYPRSLTQDAKLLMECGCDILFAPDVPEIYPEGESHEVDVDFGILDKVMEGKFRPGHFRGVAMVVNRLFTIVNPTRAYFGKKDFQQLAVILHMVNALKLPVKIIACETVREADGLAMSSRNMRLTIAERNLAPVIYQVLLKMRERSGKIPVRELKEWAIKKIHEHPGLRVEYLEICDKASLFPMGNWFQRKRSMALIAVFLGDIRLIDNIELFL